MESLASSLLWVGPALVGAALLLAAFAKASDSMAFVTHLTRFPGLAFRLARIAGPFFVVGESFLGAALVVGLWPRWTWPVALALLVALSLLSLWGIARGQLEECGCYGGWIRLTPAQSLALSVLYIVLLALATGWGTEVERPAAPWKLLVTLGIAGLAAVTAVMAWSSVRRRGRPLLVRSPLREGIAWKAAWLGEATAADLAEGERLVVFLSMECSRCNEWMGLMQNAVHPHPELPDVLGVIDLPEEELAEMREMLTFPLVALRAFEIRRLAWAMPFAVLLVDGRIREIWGDLLPESFAARLRAAHLA